MENTPETNRHLSDGLDFYKLTMGQVALEKFPDAEVTFTLNNRDHENLLSRYIDTTRLEERFKDIRERGFGPEEIAYLAGLQAQDGGARFDKTYLDYLANLKLADVSVSTDPKTQELAIAASGPWANVSLWETVVMSEVNEQYYQNLAAEQGLNLNELKAIGDNRLDQKIARLRERPDIKFADFGTRRRFSLDWQDHVIGRLADELPDNFVGTSNPWLAYKYGLKPIGTYAHEMPMVYAAMADRETGQPLDGHRAMLDDWYERYGEDLSIALPDTYTSEFFFRDFTPQQAAQWHGLRHDSGDPIEFGERTIRFYQDQGIDPATKTIVFSDGLDIDAILNWPTIFRGRVNLMFGWGTTLTNDLGLRANNFVMKATAVDGTSTVKLSDNEGKHTGLIDQVKRYVAIKDARLAGLAIAAAA